MKKKSLVFMVVAVAAAVHAGMLNTVYCPDCGNEVSTRAFMCPKCGCSREAIERHVRATDALSRLPPEERRKLIGDACFGHAMRVVWLQEERIIRNVMTNGAAAVATYDPARRKAALDAAAAIGRILDLGFTMDQVFLWRRDLVNAALGRPGCGMRKF